MRSGKVDGCLIAILVAIAVIGGLIFWNLNVEVEGRDYDKLAEWATDPSAAVQQMLVDAAADKKVTKWEYWRIDKQRESDSENRSHTDARQKALDAIAKPK